MRIILGPAPCQGCGTHVTYAAGRWREGRKRHRCGGIMDGSIGAVGVGRNPPPRPDAPPRVAP